MDRTRNKIIRLRFAIQSELMVITINLIFEDESLSFLFNGMGPVRYKIASFL